MRWALRACVPLLARVGEGACYYWGGGVACRSRFSDAGARFCLGHQSGHRGGRYMGLRGDLRPGARWGWRLCRRGVGAPWPLSRVSYWACCECAHCVPGCGHYRVGDVLIVWAGSVVWTCFCGQ